MNLSKDAEDEDDEEIIYDSEEDEMQDDVEDEEDDDESDGEPDEALLNEIQKPDLSKGTQFYSDSSEEVCSFDLSLDF